MPLFLIGGSSIKGVAAVFMHNKLNDITISMGVGKNLLIFIENGFKIRLKHFQLTIFTKKSIIYIILTYSPAIKRGVNGADNIY